MKKKYRTRKQYKKFKYLFLMFITVILYFVIFCYVPMDGGIISFQDYYPRLGITGSEWVGFKHFEKLFTGRYFFPVLRNTLIISIGKLLFGFPAPIILCLLLNEVRSLKFKKVVQTISYLPHFISWVVLASIVQTILSPSSGVVNYIIQLLGGEPIFFMGSSDWFRKVIVGSSIWRDTGWQTVVFMAAILSIDPQLYEAADLDGAGRFQKMIYVTLPCIAPTIIIMFIMATGNVIQDDFDQIYNMLNAKVMDVGDVIGTYTYRMGIEKMNFSYATAVGLFKNVVSLILVTFTNAFSRKLSGSSLW